MMRPNLFLLSQGRLDAETRTRTIKEMIDAAALNRFRRGEMPVPLQRILVVAGSRAGPDVKVLLHALDRYPRLADLHLLDTRAGSAEELARRVAGMDLLLVMPGDIKGVEAIHAAMSAGIPVLLPDAAIPTDLDFVQDGINGFRYRADDPDSLALCLLALGSLSSRMVQAIVARAYQTLAQRLSPAIIDMGPTRAGDAT
jgi:glycosyltransferase involved in cell wall biosynthesis